MRKRLADSTVEALIVLSVLTVAFAGAIAGITIWLVNYGGGTASAAATTAAETQPATTEAATTAEATTAEATTEAATTAEATTAATTAEAGGAGDATAGKAVFASAGCASCHTLAAAGATGTVGPNLDDVKPSADTVVQFVTNGAPPMPAFGKDGILTAQQIQDVAAYVSESAGS